MLEDSYKLIHFCFGALVIKTHPSVSWVGMPDYDISMFSQTGENFHKAPPNSFFLLSGMCTIFNGANYEDLTSQQLRPMADLMRSFFKMKKADEEAGKSGSPVMMSSFVTRGLTFILDLHNSAIYDSKDKGSMVLALGPRQSYLNMVCWMGTLWAYRGKPGGG